MQRLKFIPPARALIVFARARVIKYRAHAIENIENIENIEKLYHSALFFSIPGLSYRPPFQKKIKKKQHIDLQVDRNKSNSLPQHVAYFSYSTTITATSEKSRLLSYPLSITILHRCNLFNNSTLSYPTGNNMKLRANKKLSKLSNSHKPSNTRSPERYSIPPKIHTPDSINNNNKTPSVSADSANSAIENIARVNAHTRIPERIRTCTHVPILQGNNAISEERKKAQIPPVSDSENIDKAEDNRDPIAHKQDPGENSAPLTQQTEKPNPPPVDTIALPQGENTPNKPQKSHSHSKQLSKSEGNSSTRVNTSVRTNGTSMEFLERDPQSMLEVRVDLRRGRIGVYDHDLPNNPAVVMINLAAYSESHLSCAYLPKRIAKCITAAQRNAERALSSLNSEGDTE